MNDWVVREWLDRDPRLRASIVVPYNEPELAVEEIERRASDHRFVQILLLSGTQARSRSATRSHRTRSLPLDKLHSAHSRPSRAQTH